jgi:ABC-type lipoprotein export system ATPase subunit
VMVTHDAQVARAAFRLVKFRDGNIEADLTRDEFSANASAFRVAAGESPTDAA